TEYQTGLNARIGFPNEHLASGHIAELTKPMYATCIGLILKGYNDYERNLKDFATTNGELAVPQDFLRPLTPDELATQPQPGENIDDGQMKKRTKTIWGKVKDSLYEIFREDEDFDLK
ncbi:MAG TPA: hypothetical protein VK907_12950, partial [Phnomibacter sp.]|nr:hypothetical protein [Phnomibacter sp.]